MSGGAKDAASRGSIRPAYFGPARMRFRPWIAGAFPVVCRIPVPIAMNVGDDTEWGNGEVVGVFAIVVAVIAAMIHTKGAWQCPIRPQR